MLTEDTIAAIATAPGEAGISIVRISGPQCFRVADEVFQSAGMRPSERPAFTFMHGCVVDGDSVIDDALLLVMRAPHSYTGEDTVEIQGHGGIMPAKKVLRRVLDAGARLAEPGEFTKRAFLNGRIDLLQAEAVLDLIKAKTDRAATSAVAQLTGSLTASFNDIYKTIVQVAADVEATLDFPEDELPQYVTDGIVQRLKTARHQIDELRHTWDEGHLVREGAIVVISGRPNAGKSSLMNALLQRDRAIVSHIPGTTRDVIEENLVLGGMLLRLVDTAGLRTSVDEVEREGVKRAVAQMEEADFFIYVIDASESLHPEDAERLASLDASTSVIALNKSDLGLRCEILRLDVEAIPTSLVTGSGLEDLVAALSKKMHGGLAGAPDHHVAISERHKRHLEAARVEIEEALRLATMGQEGDMTLAADRLRESLEQLGLVTGQVYHDELLNSIFSRFCIGK